MEVLATIAFALYVVTPVSADVAMPTITRVYFEKNGTPVNETVTFTVNCYGYHTAPGEFLSQSNQSVSENVFSFSATCPTYGCPIFETYYLNYRHIDSCDLEGELNGENFIIRNFSSTPVPNCTSLKDYGEEINDTIMDIHPYLRERQRTNCILRFAIPPERYVPTPTPIYTPSLTPIYTHTPTPTVPLPVHVVFASFALAIGVAAMVRKREKDKVVAEEI
jgi:hypothetical protein